MSLKDKFSKKQNNNFLDSSEIENNEFYLKPKKSTYRTFNKKLLIVPIIIIFLILLFFIFKNLPEKNGESIFDLGNIMNQEAVEKDEEQQTIHSLILRNSAWGTIMDDVAIEEKGNLIDYGNDYLTCDYETLFGITWLPTYLFQDNELVAIVYEANLSLANLEELSSIHQDVAVNIHYVYEQLYRENNKWATGQDRKYDKNLWTQSILNGRLTMQSVWNSSNEKVFLVTNNKPLFGFLQKQKTEDPAAAMAFIIVSDNFLLKNEFNVLMTIKPSAKQSGSYNADGEVIDMVSPDEVNPNTQVDSTTNYVGTGISSEGLTDEEFEAIFNEINGNSSGQYKIDSNGNVVDKDGNILKDYSVDSNGNIIDENGNIVGNNKTPITGGGTTMKGPGMPSSTDNDGSNIVDTQITGGGSGGSGSSGNENVGNSDVHNNDGNKENSGDVLYEEDYEQEELPKPEKLTGLPEFED